jgi:hypothetical protein
MARVATELHRSGRMAGFGGLPGGGVVLGDFCAVWHVMPLLAVVVRSSYPTWRVQSVRMLSIRSTSICGSVPVCMMILRDISKSLNLELTQA